MSKKIVIKEAWTKRKCEECKEWFEPINYELHCRPCNKRFVTDVLKIEDEDLTRGHDG